MSFQCYTPRASLRSALTGGLFISADGSRRIVPDHWLTQAELLEGGRSLRLSYSFCTIEITGQYLDPIFEDVGIGKLGAVLAAASESASNGQLWVTSIVFVAPPEAHASVFEQECFDA
jgi:hypothetical protein